MKKFQIIVEGDADMKFFEDYYHHLFQEKAPEGSITLPIKEDKKGGYKKLFKEEAINPLKENSAYGVKNLVIFDADKDIEARRKELLTIQEQYDVEFELFLLPINPNNQPVMDCWQKYEDELNEVRIPTKTPPTLTIPAKKTKIYAYLETLLGETRTQKELIKDPNRNYENTLHWNLDAEYLEPLREFLKCNIEKDE